MVLALTTGSDKQCIVKGTNYSDLILKLENTLGVYSGNDLPITVCEIEEDN